MLEAVNNIDFKDHRLQEKFGVATPKDLCEKLLQNDVPKISEMVAEMSGYSSEDDKEDIEEIKNS